MPSAAAARDPKKSGDGTGFHCAVWRRAAGFDSFKLGTLCVGEGNDRGPHPVLVVLQAVPQQHQPPQAKALSVAHTGPLAPPSEGQTGAQRKGGSVMTLSSKDGILHLRGGGAVCV